MKKHLFLIVLTIFITSCKNKQDSKKINDSTVFDTIDPDTSDYLKYESVKINGKTIKFIVPSNEVFEDKLYDEEQAARIIHLNLNSDFKKKFSRSRLLTLIRFQGDFLEAKDNKNQNYLDYNEENYMFLKKKMKVIGIDLNLSEEEIKTIIKIESYYIELINYK